jgi:hypothetical protein
MNTDSEKTKVTDADRQAHTDASARLKESRLKLDEPAVQMTMVFQKYSDTFANLSRHETALSRSLLKNLHELQRIQAARAGEQVAAPAVMDVNVNIGQDGERIPTRFFEIKSPALVWRPANNFLKAVESESQFFRAKASNKPSKIVKLFAGRDIRVVTTGRGGSLMQRP